MGTKAENFSWFAFLNRHCLDNPFHTGSFYGIELTRLPINHHLNYTMIVSASKSRQQTKIAHCPILIVCDYHGAVL